MKILLKIEVVTSACLALLMVGCSNELKDRVKAAETITDPWAKYQVLMKDKSPNSLSVDDNRDGAADWQRDAATTLLEAMKKGSPGALQYVCKQYRGYIVLHELTGEFCANITLDEAENLLREAKVDAQNQAQKEPTQADLVAMVKRYGGHYTPETWEFPTVAARRLFEKNMVPARKPKVAAD